MQAPVLFKGIGLSVSPESTLVGHACTPRCCIAEYAILLCAGCHAGMPLHWQQTCETDKGHLGAVAGGADSKSNGLQRRPQLATAGEPQPCWQLAWPDGACPGESEHKCISIGGSCRSYVVHQPAAHDNLQPVTPRPCSKLFTPHPRNVNSHRVCLWPPLDTYRCAGGGFRLPGHAQQCCLRCVCAQCCRVRPSAASSCGRCTLGGWVALLGGAPALQPPVQEAVQHSKRPMTPPVSFAVKCVATQMSSARGDGWRSPPCAWPHPLRCHTCATNISSGTAAGIVGHSARCMTPSPGSPDALGVFCGKGPGSRGISHRRAAHRTPAGA